MRYPCSTIGILTLAAITVAACDGSITDPPSESLPEAAAAVGGAVVTQQTTMIPDLQGGATTFSGTAILERNANGLSLYAQSGDFIPGDAYTIWVVAYENPSACVGGCDPSDLDRTAVQGTVSNFGGFVADEARTYSGQLARHDDTRQLVAGVGRSGVDNPNQAQLTFVFRSHGEAETDPDKLAAQTSLVVAFCNLPVPEFPPPGCQSQGLANFAAPGAPGRP